MQICTAVVVVVEGQGGILALDEGHSGPIEL